MKNTIKKTVLLLSAACLVCLAVTGCGGKSAWSTLDQETAEAIDGSINSSSPSSNAPLKDSDLIPVIYTEDTKFYVRNISGDGGESVDTEGSFEDLELHMTIDMKGEFGSDGFHPSEIRMLRFS